MVNVSTQCLECSKHFSSLELLHKHLRAVHKTTQAHYYQHHYPRYDKFDGRMILFMSRDHYLTTDFNSRANLAAWVKSRPPEEVKEYVTQFLLDRKARKNLVYAPCQVELRTLMVPGLVYVDKLVGGYANFVKGLGFKLRFDNSLWACTPKRFLVNHKILVDTREQMPLTFSIPTQPEALPFGDYKLNDDSFTQSGCIERKAVGDLYGTMTSGFDRFCRELDRAKAAGAYVVILVEGSMDMVNAYPSQTKGLVRITHHYVYYQMRRMLHMYPNIQFLFVQNREQASRAVERIFCSDGAYRKVDLQFLYDSGGLI